MLPSTIYLVYVFIKEEKKHSFLRHEKSKLVITIVNVITNALTRELNVTVNVL